MVLSMWVIRRSTTRGLPMRLPDSDDLVLFGSLAIAALGAAFVTATTTRDVLAAVGVALVVFGIPSALIAFMAASQETK